MSNFFSIFKKEIKETINVQLIFSLVFTVLLFIWLGQMIGSQIEEATKTMKETSIVLLDLDQTPTSNKIKSILSETDGGISFGIDEITETKEKTEAVKIAKEKNLTNLLLIPSGFEKKLQSGEKPRLKFILFKGFSLRATTSSGQIESIVQSLNTR